MIEWFRSHPVITGWMFALSLALFVGSLLAMPILIARLRADYFVSRLPPAQSWRRRHALTRVSLLLMKNLLGLILFAAGIAMLVLPGQGIITILVGVSLLDFPGKRRLELAIVRLRHVRRAIAWIRQRAKRPPLILPERQRDSK